MPLMDIDLPAPLPFDPDDFEVPDTHVTCYEYMITVVNPLRFALMSVLDDVIADVGTGGYVDANDTFPQLHELEVYGVCPVGDKWGSTLSVDPGLVDNNNMLGELFFDAEDVEPEDIPAFDIPADWVYGSNKVAQASLMLKARLRDEHCLPLSDALQAHPSFIALDPEVGVMPGGWTSISFTLPLIDIPLHP